MIAEVTSQIIQLLSVVAWPTTVILLVWPLRAEIKKLAGMLSAKVKESESVKLTTEGVELVAKVQAAEARIENQQIMQADIKKIVLELLSERDQIQPARNNEENLTLLLALASEFLEIREPDWAKRILRKDQIGRRMAVHVLQSKMTKPDVVRIANDGTLVALAFAVQLSPEPLDTSLLLQHWKAAQSLYAKYRLVTAISVLLETGYVQLTQVPHIREMLDAYEQTADDPLKRRIETTRAILNTYLHGMPISGNPLRSK